MNIFFLLLSFALAYTPPEKKPSFSQMEINHIRVTTPGLFDNEKLLELHLEQIPDTAYCFPLPGGKVISPYGRGGGRHSGIDIKTCAKDTIRSAFDGIGTYVEALQCLRQRNRCAPFFGIGNDIQP